MRFLDATILIRWGSATIAEALNEDVSTCGYILAKIRDGEEAVTSTLVKDEALIWFSRYKSSRLTDFLRSLMALTGLKIVEPTIEDELEATRLFGKHRLGVSDLVNLSIMRRLAIREIYSLDKGFDDVPDVKRVFDELRLEEGYRSFVTQFKKESASDVRNLK
ncbi:MAG: type II toxin-antitoxin system VapC family toxin [Candidatus Brockarchaeota archaeon]|nr:type II toxin-antitoxin system VapC family toxin [Candidatus Brockarchaeota archaeon]MBO3808671.1 type II toxin-antitoxin system VapC family toxin [Candidatus Brockarchaeota archaeon]